MRIKSRIKRLIADEEERARRTISAGEIARVAGLNENTVRNLSLGRTRRVDWHVVERLLGYFEKEHGKEYSLDDLFEVVRE